MARVQLRDIQKAYGDVQVVHRLDLDVADGELLVLVGASGCGKSTTLRMVAGLETITSGDLYIGDRRVNEVAPRDRDIAMVFQSYALYPHMTVRQNMAFGLTLRKMAATEIAARVDEAARMLGLQELLDRKPAALSGGQRQRVAMGRAVVRQPAVFLFDEPLSNLDAKLRVQMRLEIAKLHQRLGATMLYVTHDQTEAMTLADRIAVMHQGVLQQCAPPHELYNAPANTYVATFIGSPAMNLLPVTRTGSVLQGAGLHIDLAAAATSLPAELTLGVRPQDWQPTAGDADAVLQVEVVEPLGSETFLFGTLVGGAAQVPPLQRDAATMARCDAPLIVRVAAQSPIAAGDAVPLQLDRQRLQLFSKDGNRIVR